MLPDGSYGGNPCGFLLYLSGKKKIYHACDTGLFYDMKLIGEESIDLAILPIGDNFTMGPKTLCARQAHQPQEGDTDPLQHLRRDQAGPHRWAAEVEKQTGVKAVVLNPGEHLDL